MSITIPKEPNLAALREERATLDKKIIAAHKRWEKRVETALKDVQPDAIESLDDFMALLGAPGRRAFDLQEAWIRSLGSRDVMIYGVHMDNEGKQAVGPAIQIMVPHPSVDDYAERFGGLILMLSRYQAFMEPAATDRLVIKIMDNDLSESGIPELCLESDGSCEFRMTRYGHTTTEKTFPTPADALEYLAKNRWYGTPEREEYHW